MADRPTRLVLHPGHPKCGSSSIQNALKTNADALRERGVLYPDRRPNRVFVDAAQTGELEALNAWLDQKMGELKAFGGHTLIVSVENLGARKAAEGGAAVHERLRDRFDLVDVFFYIRRPDDHLVSSWQQWGHQLGKRLDEFVEMMVGVGEPAFLQTARIFEGLYGADRVTVIPLHPSAFEGGDLLEDFGHRTGLGSLPVEAAERRQNVSMSGYLCDVLARAPSIYDPELTAQFGRGRTDHRVRRLLERALPDADLAFNNDKRILTWEQRCAIMEPYEPQSRALHERYFPHLSYEELYGLPESARRTEIETLRDHIDGLADVLAIQMALLMRLHDGDSTDPRESTVKQTLRGLKRRLGG